MSRPHATLVIIPCFTTETRRDGDGLYYIADLTTGKAFEFDNGGDVFFYDSLQAAQDSLAEILR